MKGLVCHVYRFVWRMVERLCGKREQFRVVNAKRTRSETVILAMLEGRSGIDVGRWSGILTKGIIQWKQKEKTWRFRETVLVILAFTVMFTNGMVIQPNKNKKKGKSNGTRISRSVVVGIGESLRLGCQTTKPTKRKQNRIFHANS